MYIPKIQKPYYLGHIKRLKKRAKEDKISKEEIIELLLSYIIKCKDVKPQSREIFKKCKGNFKRLFKVIETEKIIGIGEETKLFFKIIKKFINIFNQEKFLNREYKITEQEDVINYFKNYYVDEDREIIHVLFLDTKNKIIADKRISDGTLTQSLLYPREIIKEAIKESAASIIIVHNHPSGNPEPSENDKKITKKIIFALKEIDINILDHIIIGTEGKGYFSFFENGLIDKYKQEYNKILNIAEKEII